jgi:hypothetical protein
MPPGIVLAGPAYRHPAAALPHLPLSLPHPAADIRPRCCPAPPVSRATPCRLCPAALPCSPARLPRERALSPLTAPHGAIPTLWSALLCRARAPPLSCSPSSAWHRAPPPPISLSALPARPPIWRRRRCLTPLRSVPRPSLSSPPSPPSTRPPHRLSPPEPPLLSGSRPSAIASVASRPDLPICHRCPHLRPPSPSLFRADTVGSCLHRHWPPELPPRR